GATLAAAVGLHRRGRAAGVGEMCTKLRETVRAILRAGEVEGTLGEAGAGDATGPETTAFPLAGVEGALGRVGARGVPAGDHGQRIEHCATLVELCTPLLALARAERDLASARRAHLELHATHSRRAAEHNRRVEKLEQLKDEVLAVCAHDL